jgi:hypothetical protein
VSCIFQKTAVYTFLETIDLSTDARTRKFSERENENTRCINCLRWICMAQKIILKSVLVLHNQSFTMYPLIPGYMKTGIEESRLFKLQTEFLLTSAQRTLFRNFVLGIQIKRWWCGRGNDDFTWSCGIFVHFVRSHSNSWSRGMTKEDDDRPPYTLSTKPDRQDIGTSGSVFHGIMVPCI